MSSVSSGSLISNNIKSLYSKYKGKEVTPTDKQKILIEKLGGEDVSVTTSQAQKQIRYLIGMQKITKKQHFLLNLPIEKTGVFT